MTKTFDKNINNLLLEYGSANYSGVSWNTNDIANTPEAKSVYNKLGGVGRLVLDVIGLIPGAEVADIINAAWYIDLANKETDNAQKNTYYIFAGLSLISVIPTVGDVIGKGLKTAIKGGSTVLKSAKFVKLKTALKGHWQTIKINFNKFRNSRIGKYMDELTKVMYSFLFTGTFAQLTNTQNNQDNSDHEGTISSSDLTSGPQYANAVAANQPMVRQPAIPQNVPQQPQKTKRRR